MTEAGLKKKRKNGMKMRRKGGGGVRGRERGRGERESVWLVYVCMHINRKAVIFSLRFDIYHFHPVFYLYKNPINNLFSRFCSIPGN